MPENDPQALSKPEAIGVERSSEHLTTLAKGLRVLTSFSRETPSMTLSEVAKKTGLNAAVARRCLLTLCDLGYVGKLEGRFTLRPEVLVFATLFNESFDLDNTIRPALQELRSKTDHSGEPVPVPRITGPIKRRHAISVDEVKALKQLTDRPIKFTVPGPFTMAQQAQNDFYPDLREAALAYAEAVREEVEDLFAAGADIIQLDEPYLQARPEAAEAYGIEALNAALRGTAGTTCVHICFGYAALIHERPEGYSFLPQLHQACCHQISIETAQSNLDCSVLSSLPEQTILLGVIDLSSPEVESVETIVDRVQRALPYIDKERVVLAPDCGMKYLPRDASLHKLSNMVEAAKILRSQH